MDDPFHYDADADQHRQESKDEANQDRAREQGTFRHPVAVVVKPIHFDGEFDFCICRCDSLLEFSALISSFVWFVGSIRTAALVAGGVAFQRFSSGKSCVVVVAVLVFSTKKNRRWS